MSNGTIPQKVHDALLEIRDTGEVNMLDRRGVQFMADRLKKYSTVCWLEENKELYASWVFGKVPVEGPAAADTTRNEEGAV